MAEGDAPGVLIAGNWKMNGCRADLSVIEAVADGLASGAKCDVLVCPPAPLIALAHDKVAARGVAIGAQDCHVAVSGAHTGDLSAEMLKDAGASAIILGHSERRSDHGETDAEVRAKTAAAHRAGVTAIVCVGETAGQRQSGLAQAVVLRQLAGSLPDEASPANTVIAYEPVWAIGTGLVATSDDIAQIHKAIRDALIARFGPAGAGFKILYGGSVKPGNAEEILNVANVNGALVGGASLKAADFLGIIAACR